MAIQALTLTEYTREFARVLHNKSKFISKCIRGYDNRFANKGAKIGDTLNIRLPNQYRIGRTETIAAFDDIRDESIDLKVNKFFNVAVGLGAAEMALSLNDWSKQVAEPAALTMIGNIESDCLADVLTQVYNQVGTPGTAPATVSIVLSAGQRMDEFLSPMDAMRNLLVNPAANAALVGGEMKGLFQSSERIGDQYERGAMGEALGFEFYRSALMPIFTNGNNVTGVTVAGASQSGSTLTIGGSVVATNTFRKGQVFTIAGVKAINPQTKTAYPYDQQFVITADATAVGTTVALQIAPAIAFTASGNNSRDTVNSLPANSAALSFMGAANASYTVNVAFHEEAFAFATVDMEPLWGGENGYATREGIRMRISKGSNITTNQNLCRVDVLAGWRCIRAQSACRVAG